MSGRQPGGERQLWPALGDHPLGGHEQALGTLGSAGTGDGGRQALRLGLFLELGQPRSSGAASLSRPIARSAPALPATAERSLGSMASALS